MQIFWAFSFYLWSGVKVIDGILHYAVKLKKDSKIAFVSNEEAAEKWLLKVLAYLEDHVHLKMPIGRGSSNDLSELNKDSIRGTPITALAATDLHDDIEYMFEWPNGRKIARGQDFAGIAVTFLESQIDFNMVDNGVGCRNDSFHGK